MFINHTQVGCFSQRPVVKIACTTFSFLLLDQDFQVEGLGDDKNCDQIRHLAITGESTVTAGQHIPVSVLLDIMRSTGYGT